MTNSSKLIDLRRANGHSDTFVDARFEHTQERVRERYQLDIDRTEWDEINYALFVEDPSVCTWITVGDSGTTSLFAVKWRGQHMLVAYSDSAFVTMTALPRHDPRMIAYIQGRFEPRVLTSADTAFRDTKLRLAEELAGMTKVGGALVMADPSPEAPLSDPKPAYNVFADALQGFTPSVAPRPVLSIATVPATPPLDPTVMAAFAALNRFLDTQDAAVAGEDSKADEEIAALESRIRQIRSNSSVAAMKREFLSSSRRMAEDAFAKFHDGEFTSESVLSVANLLMARSVEVPAPVPVAPTTALPAAPASDPVKSGNAGRSFCVDTGPAGRSYADYSLGDPDITAIGNRTARQYRFQGMTKTITQWADWCSMRPNTFYKAIQKNGLGPMLRAAAARRSDAA